MKSYNTSKPPVYLQELKVLVLIRLQDHDSLPHGNASLKMLRKRTARGHAHQEQLASFGAPHPTFESLEGGRQGGVF